MALTRYATALTIVQRAVGALGLQSAPQTAASSQDVTIQQIWALLTEAGQALTKMKSWQDFQKTWVFSTVPGQTTYTPPDDFEGFVDATGWNRTGRLPLAGPQTPQIWQMLQAILMGSSTIRLQYRFVGDQFTLYNSPSTAQSVAVEYNSRAWVRDATNQALFRDFVMNDADTCLFESQLLVTKLKLDWLKAKGFDTAAAVEDFNEAYDDVTSRDRPAQDLYTAGVPAQPLIGPWNAPVTGYGLP